VTSQRDVTHHYFNFVQRALIASKFGSSFRRRRLLAVLNHAVLVDHERGARRGVADSGQHGNTTVVFLMTSLFRSLASVMLIFSFCAQAPARTGCRR